MRFLKFGEIQAQVPYLDDPDVLERAESNRALRSALDHFRPENWHGIGIPPDQIIDMSAVSGIPTVWVPPRGLLRELVETSPTDRPQVLMSHRDEVIVDCRRVLAECRDDWIHNEQVLLTSAIDTFDLGQHAAAMALAVAVGEPLAKWGAVPRVLQFKSESGYLSQDRRDGVLRKWEKRPHKYRDAERELAGTGMLEPLAPDDVLRRALLAPIPKFFTPYFPDKGHPLPDTVSRHAVAHQPTVEHMSVSNSLMSIMLGVSLLREQQSWAVEVRMDMRDN